jgi:glycosyltransferase involved in cell wall biosynthesis
MLPHVAFSVVIPTHNRYELLARAIRSASRQTVQDFEILIVDDCSTDSTWNYLCAERTETLRVFRNDNNLGVSGSRNRGVAEARAPYVVFLDDDDVLRPSALADIGAALKANPDAEFLWGERLIHEKDASGHIVGRRSDDWSWARAPLTGTQFLPMMLQIATNSAFTINRGLFLELGGFDVGLKVSEDRDLFIRLARAERRGVAIASVLIDVDEHFNGSLSRNVGVSIGAKTDLLLMDRYRDYFQLPQHRKVLGRYLLAVYVGYLQQRERAAARNIYKKMRELGVPFGDIATEYIRHMPEFRRAKTLLGYYKLRRLLASWGSRAHKYDLLDKQ